MIEIAGVLSVNLNQPELAISYLKELEEYIITKEEAFGKVTEGNMYSNMAVSHLRKNELNKARFYNRGSIVISKTIRNIHSLATNYLNQSVILKKLNKLDSSEYYLLEAKKLYEETGRESNWSAVYDNLGDIEFLRDNYKKKPGV